MQNKNAAPLGRPPMRAKYSGIPVTWSIDDASDEKFMYGRKGSLGSAKTLMRLKQSRRARDGGAAPTPRLVEKPGLRARRTLARDSTSSVVFSQMATRCRGEGFRESAGPPSARRSASSSAGRDSSQAPRLKAKELTNEATMSWTDERVEQLRQHWLEGKSASQIATLLGHGLTRNAVIGKVHRLGLAGRAKSPSTAASRPRASSQQAVQRAAPPRMTPVGPRIVRGATALAIAPRIETEAEPQAYDSVVLPMSLRVTIIELTEAMCRWPLGDPTSPDFRYCGSPAANGPYCGHHGRLAYQPAQERRRDRDRQRRFALR